MKKMLLVIVFLTSLLLIGCNKDKTQYDEIVAEKLSFTDSNSYTSLVVEGKVYHIKKIPEDEKHLSVIFMEINENLEVVNEFKIEGINRELHIKVHYFDGWYIQLFTSGYEETILIGIENEEKIFERTFSYYFSDFYVTDDYYLINNSYYDYENEKPINNYNVYNKETFDLIGKFDDIVLQVNTRVLKIEGNNIISLEHSGNNIYKGIYLTDLDEMTSTKIENVDFDYNWDSKNVYIKKNIAYYNTYFNNIGAFCIQEYSLENYEMADEKCHGKDLEGKLSISYLENIDTFSGFYNLGYKFNSFPYSTYVTYLNRGSKVKMFNLVINSSEIVKINDNNVISGLQYYK